MRQQLLEARADEKQTINVVWPKYSLNIFESDIMF